MASQKSDRAALIFPIVDQWTRRDAIEPNGSLAAGDSIKAWLEPGLRYLLERAWLAGFRHPFFGIGSRSNAHRRFGIGGRAPYGFSYVRRTRNRA